MPACGTQGEKKMNPPFGIEGLPKCRKSVSIRYCRKYFHAALTKKLFLVDKGGDAHYNLIAVGSNRQHSLK